MRNIVILGGTSAMAIAFARLCAAQSDTLFLVARDETKLQAVCQDLRVRGARNVHYAIQDLSDISTHESLTNKINHTLNKIDVVLIAYGTLSDQKACEASVEQTLVEMNTNCLSIISLLTILGNQFEHQKSGVIAVISSVAGDRGRKSNYIYGTAKGALSIFLQGLRHRLHQANVAVITFKPGFVNTPMTAHLPQSALYAQPEKVAKDMLGAIDKGHSRVVYTPWFWRYIMLIICHIPEKIFVKTNL